MGRVKVTYRIACRESEARKLARAIAYEQTVEVPKEIVSPRIRDAVVGAVESIRPGPACASAAGYDAVVSYDAALTGFQVPQLLNLIYGNVSIQKGIRIVDLELPKNVLEKFRGPNFGIAGIRELLGAPGRPLLATALKPNGAPLRRLARTAGDFALGGGDILKDDQNLAGESLAAFRERVSRIQEAVTTANQKTGRRTLYLPILSAPHEEIENRVTCLKRLAIPGALVCPMLLGFDRVRHLAQTHRLVLLAHPSLTGTFFYDPRHGIAPGVLLGKIFRLLGADGSIFPNVGGRFSFTRAECLDIGRNLREPLGRLRPAFPVPAGGMGLDHIETMVQDYGADAVFLIGGALLAHPKGLMEATRIAQEKIRKVALELRTPRRPLS